MSEPLKVIRFVQPVEDGDSGYAVAQPEGLDVLRDFASLAQPLAPHIAEIRRLLAEAEPFGDPDDVPADRCWPILTEGQLIMSAAGPEGLCFVLATLGDEAGERRAHLEGLIQRSWCEVPGWGFSGRAGV